MKVRIVETKIGKNSMMRIPPSHLCAIIVAVAAFVYVLTACSVQGAPTMTRTPALPTPTATPTNTPEPTATSTPTFIPTPTETVTPRPTTTNTPRPRNTPRPTHTPLPTTLPLPESTLALIGTPLPRAAEEIDANNLQRLTHAAQWGRGNILGVAFAPDGSSFIVGSAFGIATYDLDDLDSPPRWTPLDPPFVYYNLFFSSDGNYLRLEGRRGRQAHSSQVRSYADGQIVSDLSGVTWVKSTALTHYQDPSTISPDGTRELRSHVDYESVRDFECIREVWDRETGKLLYQLSDATISVQYHDYHKPEGCDLPSFSYCGNVYDPSVSTPFRVGFSPSGNSLAILYRASNLWNSNQFSTLRVYRGEDGALLHVIGSFEQPVETFAYSPDGDMLLVGYVDGSIQLWDIARGTSVFNAWHFSAPTIALAYSSDGNFLILQRPNWLEIRRTSDGSLRSRHRAVAFAASPTENLVALGSADGSILMQDMDDEQTVYHIQAHDDKVYALAFSPDGQRLTSSGQDCAVRHWDAHTGTFLHDFEENVTNAYGEQNTASRIFVHHIKHIPGTDQLIGYGSWSRVVSWDANSGVTRYLIEPEPLEYYQGMMTLNPHFPEFFDIDLKDGHFYVDNVGYSLETGEKVGEYQPPTNLPEGCAPAGPVSKDGELLFTKGYDNREGQICILDAQDLRMIQAIQVIPIDARAYAAIDWLYLSPDGSQLIVNTLGGLIYVYSIAP